MKFPISITPYRELRSGDQSIYDSVQEGYTIPPRVVAYLRAGRPYLMMPGIYPHPFKPGKRLLGPYKYTDGTYSWDRDTWKYAVKYHVVLPREFIDHVMSEAGAAFLAQYGAQTGAWSDTIKQWKERRDILCLLPDDAGETQLEEF